jgi:hypothetical protein
MKNPLLKRKRVIREVEWFAPLLHPKPKEEGVLVCWGELHADLSINNGDIFRRSRKRGI